MVISRLTVINSYDLCMYNTACHKQYLKKFDLYLKIMYILQIIFVQKMTNVFFVSGEFHFNYSLLYPVKCKTDTVSGNCTYRIVYFFRCSFSVATR